jgi:hypothetical protein
MLCADVPLCVLLLVNKEDDILFSPVVTCEELDPRDVVVGTELALMLREKITCAYSVRRTWGNKTC